MITVINSVDSWLSITETWLHTQIVFLPEGVDSHVLCSRRINPGQFAVPRLYCAEGEEGGVRFFFDKVERKLLGRRRMGSWYRTAHSLRPAIWHSHFADQAWHDDEVAKWCGARHVLGVYGADISQLPGILPWSERIPEMLRKIDLVLCEGPFMARQVTRLGCAPERTRVHHLGVPLDRIPFKPRQWRLGTPLKVLIAGTFREKKGIPYALEALGRISDDVELQITLIGDAGGKPTDVDEKGRIMRTLEQTGLMPKTRLLGFQPYPVLLEEGLGHHIFLSPSIQAVDGDNEGGSPVTITEMAASGMMIISSRHCDIPEVIPDGTCGLLADERDVEGLEKHLRWLVDNPDSWMPIQRKARLHIEKEYDAVTQGRRLAQIYEELVSSAG